MTYHIEPARADSDFASIRKVYYETWLSAYRDLIPEAALKQLTPAICVLNDIGAICYWR